MLSDTDEDMEIAIWNRQGQVVARRMAYQNAATFDGESPEERAMRQRHPIRPSRRAR